MIVGVFADSIGVAGYSHFQRNLIFGRDLIGGKQPLRRRPQRRFSFVSHLSFGKSFRGLAPAACCHRE
jgi:hypothetical protein